MRIAPRLKSIEEPVADAVWKLRSAKGRSKRVRVTVGKPRQIPNDRDKEWYCPLLIENVTDGVISVIGVGPVDALMNAMIRVQRFFEENDVTPTSPSSVVPPA